MSVRLFPGTLELSGNPGRGKPTPLLLEASMPTPKSAYEDVAAAATAAAVAAAAAAASVGLIEDGLRERGIGWEAEED